MALVAVIDLLAVFIFALTGALVASRARLDPIGFLFLACVTGVGGGTLRDLLLNRSPVFWIENPLSLGVACLAGILVFFSAHRLRSRYTALLWLDAMALAVAVSAGVIIAQSAGVSAPIVVVMGIITGTFGGLMRDVVANEIPLVLRKRELYVSAAFAGAVAGLIVSVFIPEPQWLAVLSVSSVTFALRAGSLRFGWQLPVFREKAPETEAPSARKHREDGADDQKD